MDAGGKRVLVGMDAGGRGARVGVSIRDATSTGTNVQVVPGTSVDVTAPLGMTDWLVGEDVGCRLFDPQKTASATITSTMLTMLARPSTLLQAGLVARLAWGSV